MRRLRGVLVVVECSLAVVVLAGAGLLLRSLQRMHAVDPGFNPKGVLAVRLEYAPETVPPESATRSATLGTEAASAANFAARLDELTTRLAAMPGVQSVGYVGDMFVVQPGNKSITIPGRTDDVVSDKLDNDDVSPGFFPTMGVPIVRGRNLMPEDVVTKIRALWQPIVNDRSLAEKERLAIPEPVVVNEAFVRRFFPNEDPIGRRFCIDPTRKTYWYTIVGVAGDMRRRGLERDAIPEYFGPYLPSANGRADLLVRASDDPLRLAPMIRQVISAELPGTIVVSATTADQQLGDFAAQRDLQTGLLTLFGALAVILAAIGIYGVSHYAVAERTREMGVRMALGASPAALVVQVIREGVTMPLVGIALGAGLALSTTRLLSHLLFGVAATDPLTFTTVLAALVGVAFVACVIPARRAARVDPLTALRSDFVR
jgi:predicted permease